MPTPALRVGLHHQARAVERVRAGAAPQVGLAELLPGVGDGLRGGPRRRSAGRGRTAVTGQDSDADAHGQGGDGEPPVRPGHAAADTVGNDGPPSGG